MKSRFEAPAILYPPSWILKYVVKTADMLMSSKNSGIEEKLNFVSPVETLTSENHLLSNCLKRRFKIFENVEHVKMTLEQILLLYLSNSCTLYRAVLRYGAREKLNWKHEKVKY